MALPKATDSSAKGQRNTAAGAGVAVLEHLHRHAARVGGKTALARPRKGAGERGQKQERAHARYSVASFFFASRYASARSRLLWGKVTMSE